MCGEQESASGDDGHLNNRLCLVDCRAAVFRWRPEWGAADSVVVSTSADNWVARTPLQRDAPGGVWSVTMPLPAATRVEFKSQLDGKGRAAPGAPGHLGHLRISALGRAQIAAFQPHVGIDHPHQGEFGEMVAFGDQLRAHDHINRACFDFGDEFGSLGGGIHRV